ncbi:MAG: glycosyltransferase family A protein [Blastocatellia bacterium]|nr:glycosyltransferase family A protein [Blastocatellia bacterium]
MISVILPVYNQSRYLVQAVESVWAQRFDDLELLIVDDGSTDQTPAVIQQLAQRGPLRAIRQENAGPAAARNRGIRESRGEWIAFLDADCYWIPGKLRAQMAAVGQGALEFCYCGSLLVDDQDTVMKTRISQRTGPLLDELIWGNCLSTSSALVRKTRLLEVGLFNEELRIGEDWDLWLRLAARVGSVYVPAALMAERFNDWDRKYKMPIYEQATRAVLRRFYGFIREEEGTREILARRRLVTSWHLSVLARSYLHHRSPWKFVELGVETALTHPRGIGFLFKLHDRPDA